MANYELDEDSRGVEAALIADPESFGLAAENIDERRAIFSISAPEAFLDQPLYPVIGDGAKPSIKKFFDRHPEGMKQLFIKTSEEEARLGDHFHTPVTQGGMGEEGFLFTHIPLGSSVTIAQYDIERSQGNTLYDIPTGTVVLNKPFVAHTFNVMGPVSFVQVTEGAEFVPDDLKPFVLD